MQSLCPDSMDLDNKYIIAEDAIVDPSQATMIFQSLFFIGIRHLGHGLSLSLAISFIRILTSATSLASLVLRSKSFSANDVMSQALLNMIFKEHWRGPRNGPEIFKL